MSFFEFVNFLTEINRFTGLPGIILFVTFYKRIDGGSAVIYLMLLISFIADNLNHIFIWEYLYHRVDPAFNSYIFNNNWILIDFYLASWWTVRLVPRRRKLVLVLMKFFTVVALISFSFSFSFFESNTFTKSLWSISLSIYTILIFIEILKTSPMRSLSQHPVFWINTGLFLFASTSLFSYLTEQHLVFDLEISWFDYAPIHFFTVFFNILKNFFICYAFILIAKGNNPLLSTINSRG